MLAELLSIVKQRQDRLETMQSAHTSVKDLRLAGYRGSLKRLNAESKGSKLNMENSASSINSVFSPTF